MPDSLLRYQIARKYKDVCVMSRGRQISPGEKLLIVADAVLTDARTAAEKWDVAQTSVWQWAKEKGGLQALRDTYNSRSIPGVFQPEIVTGRALERSISRLSNAHLTRLAIHVMDQAQAVLVPDSKPKRRNRRRASRRSSSGTYGGNRTGLG